MLEAAAKIEEFRLRYEKLESPEDGAEQISQAILQLAIRSKQQPPFYHHSPKSLLHCSNRDQK